MKLRQLMNKDIEGILEWMNDSMIRSNFQFTQDKVSIEQVNKFILNSYTEDNKHFAIVNQYDEYMGTVSLKNISLQNKHAEYAIVLRQVAIGTGLASEATKQILHIAFNELELNKIYLNVLSENVRAIKFYKKFGFIFEGEFKSHLLINSQFKDLSWFAIFSIPSRKET